MLKAIKERDTGPLTLADLEELSEEKAVASKPQAALVAVKKTSLAKMLRLSYLAYLKDTFRTLTT